MTQEAAFRNLASELYKLQEAVKQLHLTLCEDAPRDAPALALLDSLGENSLAMQGTLQEALSAVKDLGDTPANPGETRHLLRTGERAFRRLISVYSRFSSQETKEALMELAASRRGEWPKWVRAAADAIECCSPLVENVNAALSACWEELAESVVLMVTRREPEAVSGPAPGLEYARSLFGNVTAWYENADRKAQVLLGIDGAFLAFLTSSVFAKPDEVTRLVKAFKADTWILLSLMCVALTASIISAIACLWSRVYRRRQLDEWWQRLKIETPKPESYAPEVMWFFQMIARLDKDGFRERLQAADPQFETRALASQIFELSRNVLRKHHWLNWGFTLAGASLILFMSAMVSYLARLR